MSETITRAYKYRLYPTPEQAERLDAWQQACHDVQFACILQRRIAWGRVCQGHHHTLPTWTGQAREVTELRGEYDHLGDVPADTMGYVVKRVDTAYERMREKRRNGKRATVRWAKRHTDIGLEFRGKKHRGTKLVHRNDRFGWWKLASANRSLGELKVRMHRPIPEEAQCKRVHLTREADGWYISFACEIPKPEPLDETGKVVGIDLGCIHEGDEQRVAVTSDNDIYKVPDNLKTSLSRLATLQKLVSPDRSVNGSAKQADPDSNRTKRRRKKIAKLHQTIARQRKHHLQYIARMLVERYDIVALEDIDWKALRRNGGAHKKGLNRSMSTASPGLLIRLVKEKAEETGRTVVEVPAAYTSQACHECGAIGERKDLSVREWKCSACGATHDRDVNAARNIRKRALEYI